MAENTLNILKPSVNNLTAPGERAVVEPAADVRGSIASVKPLPA
jgi:hypothetical protein